MSEASVFEQIRYEEPAEGVARIMLARRTSATRRTSRCSTRWTAP